MGKDTVRQSRTHARNHKKGGMPLVLTVTGSMTNKAEEAGATACRNI